jgi:hypothetical protein
MNITDILDGPEYPRRRINALARLEKEMRLVKQMEAIARPLRQWEELQRQLAPMRQMEKIKQQLGPYYDWEAKQKLLAPLGNWEALQKSAGLHAHELLKRHLPLSKPDLHLQQVLNVPNFNAVQDAVTTHERLHKAATQNGEWFDKFQRQTSVGVFAAEFERHAQHARPAFHALAEAQKTFDRVAASFQHLDASAFQLDDDDEDAVEQEVEALAEAATAEPTLAAAVAQLAAAVEAQQNPSIQLRLWMFFKQLMWVIIGAYISAVIAQQLPAPAPQGQPQTVKSIMVATRSAVGSPELLTEYRIVTARALNVRQNPRARSPKLAELPFGSAVRLVRKDGDFALVVWLDTTSGAEIHGWVFARYLQKFT